MAVRSGSPLAPLAIAAGLMAVIYGGGHVSGQSGWVHFGIGEATAAQVRVRWPGEDWGTTYAVDANGFAILDKTAATATAWTPPR